MKSQFWAVLGLSLMFGSACHADSGRLRFELLEVNVCEPTPGRRGCNFIRADVSPYTSFVFAATTHAGAYLAARHFERNFRSSSRGGKFQRFGEGEQPAAADVFRYRL